MIDIEREMIDIFIEKLDDLEFYKRKTMYEYTETINETSQMIYVKQIIEDGIRKNIIIKFNKDFVDSMTYGKDFYLENITYDDCIEKVKKFIQRNKV